MRRLIVGGNPRFCVFGRAHFDAECPGNDGAVTSRACIDHSAGKPRG